MIWKKQPNGRSERLLVVTFCVCMFVFATAPALSWGQFYAFTVLSDGPVAYWQFNETEGTTAINLGSLGSAADGTYTDAVTLGAPGPNAPGPNLPGLEPNNHAISVGPTQGYVATSVPILDSLSAFTISGFIRPADRATTRIGLAGQNDAIEFGFIDPQTIQIWTPAVGGLNVAYPFPSDEWHHIATTGDGQDVTVYFDGMAAGSLNAPTADYGSSAFNVSIGGGGVYDATGNQFTGGLDEFAIFDKALTEEQIFIHYASSMVPEPSTTALLMVAGACLALLRRRTRAA